MENKNYEITILYTREGNTFKRKKHFRAHDIFDALTYANWLPQELNYEEIIGMMIKVVK